MDESDIREADPKLSPTPHPPHPPQNQHPTPTTQQKQQVLVMGAALDAVQLRRAEHELDVLEGGCVCGFG